MRVLDAGSGYQCPVPIPDHAHVTGIDVNQAALARNPRLDERIVGDIETHRWLPGSFDLVICWDVLEHLRDPYAALERLAEAVAPAGTMILGLPNVASPKGLVTKFTPFWFHVWVYRHVYGWKDATLDGKGPFPTYHRFGLRARPLSRKLRQLGLRVDETVRYGRWRGELKIVARRDVAPPSPVE